MGTCLHRKLSTYVLKINIFNIGKRYGVNNKRGLHVGKRHDVSLVMPNTI